MRRGGRRRPWVHQDAADEGPYIAYSKRVSILYVTKCIDTHIKIIPNIYDEIRETYIVENIALHCFLLINIFLFLCFS